MRTLKNMTKHFGNYIAYGFLVVTVAFALAGVQHNETELHHEIRARAAAVAREASIRASALAHDNALHNYNVCVDTNKRFDNARNVFLATQKDQPIPPGAIPSQVAAVTTANARRAIVRDLIDRALPDKKCGARP